ncbi:MAG: prepilin-type N-terminal cleavage/methylation domain-containing protein [Puniceicoccales bacterium]|jgi:prepilin-type N-terminal cleavage/methylation domain-containing protein|nr:prepilin-type N-terminal cleavage/methylation domain-containing protein [Puniceicoccales bacterium]
MRKNKEKCYKKAFTLMEVVLVIAILATLGGIALRLFGPKSLFHNGVISFSAYVKSVCEYAFTDEKNCYLLLGRGKSNGEKISQLVLVEMDDTGNVSFVAGYAYELQRGEFIVEPGKDRGSYFSAMEISLPAEWASRRCYVVDLRRSIRSKIRLVLAFQTSKNILYHAFIIWPNGTLTQEEI